MNIMDAYDSYLSAKVRVTEWEQEFNTKFYEPIGRMILDMAMQSARKSSRIDQGKLMSNLSPQAQKKFRGE